jgi:tetratricopeptide (TPR) repeat protein
MKKRWAVLAASAAAACLGLTGAAYAQAKPEASQAAHAVQNGGPAPSDLFRASAPPNAAVDRTYASPKAALLAADIDYLVREGRRAIARGDRDSFWYTTVFADDIAAGRLSDARATLEAAPGGIHGSIADLLEPFLLAAEGHADRGVERVDSGADNLPAPLPEVERALIFESAGRLQEAAAVYSLMAEHLDVTPPGEAEPQTAEEFERALNATRVSHALYRAALVEHRLGRVADARRYYQIVAQFAPRSADVEANLARLDAGQPPVEAPLDAKSATGRWLVVLSEYLTQAEAIAAMIRQEDPSQDLTSVAGTAMLQVGVLLAGDANDWRLYAAQQALAGGGLDGAQRIVDLIPAESVFAPDAQILRASIEVERRNTAGAVAAAERALAIANGRWPVIASVGDIYRRVGQADRAIPAFDRALSMVQDPKDRADVLGYRAYAHRFAGDLAAATADMRAAYEMDPSVDTRLLYVSILMDDPAAWRDGIAMARTLFAEQPDSVLRLNALGYALIQHPEGLEEGYRLLWRGFNISQTDYSLIDSLGWAYYLYGHFDEARSLVERANQLSSGDPNFEVLDHLGDIYWRLNRREDARASWRQALDAQPDVPRRRAIEQKVEHGVRAAAPRRRELPQVSLPNASSGRQEL